MNHRACLAAGALLFAHCGGESSVTDLGEVPYHVEVRLLDPNTGDPLAETAGAASWPLAMAEAPIVEVTYWADRETPALAVVLRATGASFAGAEDAGGDPYADPYGDPYGEDPYGLETGAAAEISVPLGLIGAEHRTVRVSLAAPDRPCRAVVTGVLGGAVDSVAIDFTAVDAALSAPATGVADSLTPVDVTVTGLAGQIIDLETSLGTFVAPAFAATATLTLRPVEPGSTDGSASVGLVSDTAGPAVVTVAGAPTEWLRIDFDRVRLSFGAPDPVDFLAGQVVHEICVTANTAAGELSLAGTSLDAQVLDGGPVPVLVADAGLPESCPAGAPAGYAVFRWAGSAVSDTLTASWTSPDYVLSATAAARVTAASFGGYSASLASTVLGFDDPYPLLLTVELTFDGIAGLASRPAGNVPLTFLVVSAWGATELAADYATDARGVATALYEVVADDELQVFVQPEGWSTLSLGSAP